MNRNLANELSPAEAAIARDQRRLKRCGKYAVASMVLMLIGGAGTVWHEDAVGWNINTLNDPISIVDGFILGLGAGGIVGASLTAKDTYRDLQYRQQMQRLKNQQ